MSVVLEPGQPAPDFQAIDQDGKNVSLSDFRGSKLALYFYPEDDTPVCTVQACNLRDNFQLLLSKGVKILGVSPNDAASHQKFIQKFDLPFPLVADTDKKLIEAYGVWGEKNMYGKKYMGVKRFTYLIDEKGVIVHVFRKVNTKIHAEEILKKFQL